MDKNSLASPLEHSVVTVQNRCASVPARLLRFSSMFYLLPYNSGSLFSLLYSLFISLGSCFPL